MIDFDNLTIWDTYKIVMNAKPLSSNRVNATKQFDLKFDDMRFNEAVDVVTLEEFSMPFVYGFGIEFWRGEYHGTGHFGDPIDLLDGEDYLSKGKRVKGSRFWSGGLGDEVINENYVEYETFDDVFTEAMYSLKIWNLWKDYVTERIYQNNRNENKFLSVYEFINEWRQPEYYLLQYIETYNPKLDKTNINYMGNRWDDDTHHQWQKNELDALLEDYTLVDERHPD